jgi:ferredoxin/nitrate reductase gamma subunit
MSVRVDPAITAEMAQFGGETAIKCFNCGNCTAACSLTSQDSVFPRRYIRYIQLGLKEKMRESLDPWLCYYCGECSDTCPREAQPGKLMTASRRWLIATYDWTGISRLMYRQPWFEVLVLGLVALVVLALFTLPDSFGFRLLAEYPRAQHQVMLQYFAPKEIVHWGDVILAGGLAALLLSNAARMIWFVRRRAVPARAQDLVAELSEFFVQGATQRRWLECDTISRKHWLRHIALVAAYGTMFALVVVFLYWFQVQDASFHWTSLPGYLSTLLLLGATSWILLDRRRKHDQIHKDSDLADWLFVILLFLTALSGILLHGARLLNLAMATYVLYMVHLMIAVPMLVVEVPFSKWSHMLYRPLALYLLAVQRRTAPASQKQWSGHPAVTA